MEAGQSFSTHDRLAASALRFLIDWKQHIAFALVITFRMKWARSSNLRRMISLDRNPGFAERNRLSAKASRRDGARSALPRARPLRHRARVLCDAARSSGQLDLPRQPLPGVPECLEASRRSVNALAAPAWLGVGRASIGYGRPGVV